MGTMSLTPSDLVAIKNIVESESDRIMQVTANGFADVYARLDDVHVDMGRLEQRFTFVEDSVVRVETKLDAEVARGDKHEGAIASLNRELGLL